MTEYSTFAIMGIPGSIDHLETLLTKIEPAANQQLALSGIYPIDR